MESRHIATHPISKEKLNNAYKAGISNAQCFRKQLETLDYKMDPTERIERILNSAIKGNILEVDELQEIDISVKNLCRGLPTTAVYKPADTSLPERIKYASGINWASCEKSEIALLEFWDWYAAQPDHTKRIDLSGPQISHIDNKLVSFWKNQRKHSIVKSEKRQSSRSPDEDPETLQLFLNLKTKFLKFVMGLTKWEERTYHQCIHKYMKFLVRCETSEVKIDQTRRIFKNHSHEFQEVLKYAKYAESKRVKSSKQTLMADFLITNDITFTSEKGEALFAVVGETERFQDWILNQNIPATEKHETDQQTDDEERKRASRILSNEFKDAVDFFVVKDPMYLVENLKRTFPE